MGDRFIKWPTGPINNQVFTSDNGNTWVFDGCGWVSSCCAADSPAFCDPMKDGLSIIWSAKDVYNCSTFLWNSALSRYEGLIDGTPCIIFWTGLQWELVSAFDLSPLATLSTQSVVGSWTNVQANIIISQSICGELYPQLCFKSEGVGGYTLSAGGFTSEAEIFAGVQPTTWYGESPEGFSIGVNWDSLNSWWYIYESASDCVWTISTSQTYQALISGSPWPSNVSGDCTGTFLLGACTDSCNPYFDGITVITETGEGFTPTYFVWNTSISAFTPPEGSYNTFFGVNGVVIENTGGLWYCQIPGGTIYGTSNNLLNSLLSSWTPDESGGLSSISVYCGYRGCPKFCLSINSVTYTMWPGYFATEADALDCNETNSAWIGRNTAPSEIQLVWNVSGYWDLNVDLSYISYTCSDALTGVTSHNYSALISSSPYFTTCSPGYAVTLQSGDCPPV